VTVPPRVSEACGLRLAASVCPRTLYPVPCTLYPVFMTALAHAGLALFTWLFFLGAAGSLLVILLSFFEDLADLFGKE
jgi:hypothetical protein